MEKKTVWCYVDGKKHCDVIKWALASKMTLADAKKALSSQYPNAEVVFKVR